MKRDRDDRWTMPVIERYVRRLIHDSNKQYRTWLKANDPAPTPPTGGSNG